MKRIFIIFILMLSQFLFALNIFTPEKTLPINSHEYRLDEELAMRASDYFRIYSYYEREAETMDNLAKEMLILCSNEDEQNRILNKYKNSVPKEIPKLNTERTSSYKPSEEEAAYTKRENEMYEKRLNKFSQDLDKIVLFYWASISKEGKKNSNYSEFINVLKTEDLRLYNMKRYFEILQSMQERKDKEAESILLEKIDALSKGNVGTKNSYLLNLAYGFSGCQTAPQKGRKYVSEPRFIKDEFFPTEEVSKSNIDKKYYILEYYNVNFISGKEMESAKLKMIVSSKDDVFFAQETGEVFFTELAFRIRENKNAKNFVDLLGGLILTEIPYDSFHSCHPCTRGFYLTGTIPLGQEIELKNESLYLRKTDTDIKYFIKITPHKFDK